MGLLGTRSSSRGLRLEGSSSTGCRRSPLLSSLGVLQVLTSAPCQAPDTAQVASRTALRVVGQVQRAKVLHQASSVW